MNRRLLVISLSASFPIPENVWVLNGWIFSGNSEICKSCSACTRCDEDSGSFVKVKCTKYTDTVCGCREGFVHYSSDYAICKCDKGSGLKDGVCSRCEEGYFSTDIDSSCQKWKDCKSAGIKKAGNETSDVICNEELNAKDSLCRRPVEESGDSSESSLKLYLEP
ncbi:tumor necrosis factor receptor superfamily member 4-like [Fundulus diaphanus]